MFRRWKVVEEKLSKVAQETKVAFEKAAKEMYAEDASLRALIHEENTSLLCSEANILARIDELKEMILTQKPKPRSTAKSKTKETIPQESETVKAPPPEGE